MRVLINTPNLSIHSGGVSNHYIGLKPFWNYEIDYNVVGKRKGYPRLFALLYDYIRFIIICAIRKYDLIVLNPSLGRTAIKRDSLFLKIAKCFNMKVLIFFHGWDVDMVSKINLNPNKFKQKFITADAFLVLSKDFKFDLINF